MGGALGLVHPAVGADIFGAPPRIFYLLQGQIGGKGSVRRKKKTVHKAASMDDKRLQGTFKRLGLNTIPSIEEVRHRARPPPTQRSCRVCLIRSIPLTRCAFFALHTFR